MSSFDSREKLKSDQDSFSVCVFVYSSDVARFTLKSINTTRTVRGGLTITAWAVGCVSFLNTEQYVSVSVGGWLTGWLFGVLGVFMSSWVDLPCLCVCFSFFKNGFKSSRTDQSGQTNKILRTHKRTQIWSSNVEIRRIGDRQRSANFQSNFESIYFSWENFDCHSNGLRVCDKLSMCVLSL